MNLVNIPELKGGWDFVERFHPNYHRCDDISLSSDLDKLLEKYCDEGDGAHQLLMNEYGGDIDNLKIKYDFNEVNRSIYLKAVDGFIDFVNAENKEGLPATLPKFYTDWAETHFYISNWIEANDVSGIVSRRRNLEGQGGMYDLSRELTDRFQVKYGTTQWDGGWVDMLEEWLDNLDKESRVFYQPEFKCGIDKSPLYRFEVFRDRAVAQSLFPSMPILEFSGSDIENPTFVDDNFDFVNRFGLWLVSNNKNGRVVIQKNNNYNYFKNDSEAFSFVERRALNGDLACVEAFNQVMADFGREVNTCVRNLFISIGCDVPANIDEIVEFCNNDVWECADKFHWHSADVVMAFRRWMESDKGG